MNRMMFNPSPFFPKPKAVIMQVQKRVIFLHWGVWSTLGWSDREARRLSGARGAKRQTSARSANARATPGWPANLYYTTVVSASTGVFAFYRPHEYPGATLGDLLARERSQAGAWAKDRSPKFRMVEEIPFFPDQSTFPTTFVLKYFILTPNPNPKNETFPETRELLTWVIGILGSCRSPRFQKPTINVLLRNRHTVRSRYGKNGLRGCGIDRESLRSFCVSFHEQTMCFVFA